MSSKRRPRRQAGVPQLPPVMMPPDADPDLQYRMFCYIEAAFAAGDPPPECSADVAAAMAGMIGGQLIGSLYGGGLSLQDAAEAAQQWVARMKQLAAMHIAAREGNN